MKLRRKVEKIFNGAGVASARKYVRRWLNPPNFPLNRQRILETIDLERFGEVRRRYAQARWSKFLDLESWIDINLITIKRCGLDTGQRQRILDLGCGAGYFAYIAQLLGHDCIGLDINDDPMFVELSRLLGIQRMVWRIEACKPLPSFDGKKFDLGTGYRVCFNNHKRPDLWGVADWEFFLNDLARHIAPNGRVWLELNLGADGTFYTPQLERLFVARKADIKGSRLLFQF
jgi:SAM-dependent methyltransferase